MSKYPKPPFKAIVIDTRMVDLKQGETVTIIKVREEVDGTLHMDLRDGRGGYYFRRFKPLYFNLYYEQIPI